MKQSKLTTPAPTISVPAISAPTTSAPMPSAQNAFVHTLPYAPRPLQWQFHEQRTRFCVLLCHRRFGKTVAAINDILRQALRHGSTADNGSRENRGQAGGKSDWRAAYMAPFSTQAKTIAWDYLKFFTQNIPHTRFSETELRCTLPTGASIRLFGVDNANALRGMYLDDVVLDEPADMPREVWTRILRPMLADRQGRALFCGTPNGVDNLLHDVWEEAGKSLEKSHENTTPLWSRFAFKASQTGYIAHAELKAARLSMNKEDYQQEFECSFAAAVRGAYYTEHIEQLEHAKRITHVPYVPELPVHTAWDLGMDDATGIWFFQVESGGQWRMLEYVEDSGQGLQHYIQLLQSKPYVYGRHIAPHDIKVRELGTGLSRLEMAAKLGISFSVCPSLSLADGINAVRSHLSRMWFDVQACAQGLRALRQYRRNWRPRQEMYSSAPVHDWSSHACDALRYAVLGFRPEQRPTSTKAKIQYDIWR